MFCTKCKINWKSLPTQDDEIGDEQYSYCPICHTDAFLDNSVGEYVMCRITGKIFNVKTGEALQLPVQELPGKPPVIFDYEAWEKKREAAEQAQDERINAYIRVFESQGPEAANAMYFSDYNPVSQVANIPLIKLNPINIKLTKIK